MHQYSPPIPVFHALSRAFTVIPLLPAATFTPYIQPNLQNTYTLHQHSSRNMDSSILSTCPNHLNTIRSALLENPLSVSAMLCTSLFLTLSIRDTPNELLKYFISRAFTFIHSALLITHASVLYNAVGTIITSYRYFFAFIPNPLLFNTLFSAPHALYPSFILLYHIPFTTVIHCHLRPQIFKTVHFL